MKRQQLPLYAIAVAILVVGPAMAGAPLSTLLFVPIVLACPLMMMFMMGGMHADHSGRNASTPADTVERRDIHRTFDT